VVRSHSGPEVSPSEASRVMRTACTALFFSACRSIDPLDSGFEGHALDGAAVTLQRVGGTTPPGAEHSKMLTSR